MTVSLVAKAVQRASTAGTRRLGVAWRVPYMHYWTRRDGASSLVCFHNVYSILDPDVRQPCQGVVRVHDARGRRIASTRLEVEPRGSRMVDVARVLDGAGAAADEGSLELDIVPPGDFDVTRGGRAPRPEAASGAVIGVYFYMVYRSPAGMLTTVHSIERGATHRGVPAPLGRLLGVWTKSASAAWRSKRVIWAEGLRELRVVTINHAGGARRMHVGVRRGADGPVVAEAEASVPPRGLLVLPYRPGAGDDERPYLVFSRALATPNGKPYVWVGYRDGPMSVHHG